MSARADWGMVSVTEGLMQAARDLSQLAYEFRQESRSWTHPAARTQLEDQAAELVTMSQQAALASSTGDYWTRLAAVRLAEEQVGAAHTTLRLWFQRGELWNEHRLRPVPATVARELGNG